MRKILVINRLGIGDVVLTTPLAQLIKDNMSARVGFVVASKAADLLVNHPYIDDVFAYKSKPAKELIRQIKKVGYEEALIVDERLTSTALAFRAGCQLRNMGYGITVGEKRFFKRSILAKKAVLDYAAYIKYVIKEPKIKSFLPIIGRLDDPSIQKIDTWFQEQNFGSKVVLIVSQGLTENKNWVQSYFSRVTQYLNKKNIIPIYVGSRDNEAYISQIEGKKITIAGRFSLRELAYIAEQADLCITICSGPMHVIATANTPTIALYGPTCPERWAPPNALVIQSSLPCVPCETAGCTDTVKYRCMKEIGPEFVINGIQKQLNLD